MQFLKFRKEISNSFGLILGLLSIIILILLWQAIALIFIPNPLFLPTPFDVFRAMYELFARQGFLNDIIVSVCRVGMGYILSIAFAVPLGLFIGSYPIISALFLPFTSFFRFVPVSAFVPLLILWFGIGNTQKVLLIFIGVSFYLMTFVVAHVRSVKQEYIDSALTLGAGNIIIIVKVIFPATSKATFDSIRTLLGGGWTLIVLAELVAAEKGVGRVIIDSQRFLHTDRLVAAIIIVGLIGYLSDLLLKILEPSLFPWEQVES